MKSWISKHFYSMRFYPRHLSEFSAICDICGKPVGFSDFGYMCREHGLLYYHSRMGYMPKFLFKWLIKNTGEYKFNIVLKTK